MVEILSLKHTLLFHKENCPVLIGRNGRILLRKKKYLADLSMLIPEISLVQKVF
ncbi:hypothetical protein ESCAB7627_2742 [Escherichia albertii TW07627]|uniref:AraC family transcriptional regulator n=1 Tax=Escherichia albertii (strain TW07627) TaxID=502347 RepID=A0ABC9NLS9_ESCAT|nr:hypothetical protein EAKF1_ch0090c [Escherichia albertii KF1]EDS91191.1 hypothetical protein ESCAB7627_2742 [Escherichia albertii TW07627]